MKRHFCRAHRYWVGMLTSSTTMILTTVTAMDRTLAADLDAIAQPCLTELQNNRQFGEMSVCETTIETLIEIGLTDSDGTPPVGGPPPGLAAFQRALVLASSVGDQATEVRILNHIGDLYLQVGRYPQAIQQHEKALAVARALDQATLVGTSLNSLGRAHTALGLTQAAVSFHEEAKAVFLEVADLRGEAATWIDLGTALMEAEQLKDARDSFAQGLDRYRHLEDSVGEATALLALGESYQAQRESSQALMIYEQALAVAQDEGTLAQKQTALTRIGGIYHLQRRYDDAISTYQQALAISQQRERLADEATLWQNIGLSYVRSQNAAAAITAFQKAATLYEVLGYRGLQGESLSNTAQLLKEQDQPELAIALYKEAINVLEAVRADLRVLPLELQSSFPQTFAGTYRALADLLLEQNRVEEAQQVLDLLKIQEIDEYLKNPPADDVTPLGVASLPSEDDLVQLYDQTVESGRELAELRRIPPSSRTFQEQDRIATLVMSQQNQVADFNTFIASSEVQAIIQDLNTTSQGQNLDLRDLNSLQDNLRQLQGAVLIYPLILPDRLELVLVTPDAPPLRRPVSVTETELKEAIFAFREALVNPQSDVQPLAESLYTWLIEPLEGDLAQANAEMLLYAPDGQLRYVPLAALHDGEQWLAERFQSVNITAASLTDFDVPPPEQYSALAAGFSEGQYQVQVGTRQVNLRGLPFAGVEVASLAQVFPHSNPVLNQDFSPVAIIPQMDDYSIVHLATHAEFLSGDPEASFILFGNGDRVTLRDVSTWNLPNVNLIVLSACQTAVGGQLGTGEEILGFGYQLQRAGVESAIASLWAVDDGGTQALMSAFYQALSTGQSKAAAMRQAQLALIQNDQELVAQTQRSIAVVPVDESKRAAQLPSSLSHPYYWASFILIGNGL